VRGFDYVVVVNHRTAGRAKSAFFSSLTDAWPDVPFTDLRVRKVGAPVTGEQFEHCARIRGVSGWRCGDRVAVLELAGAGAVLVGSDSSACFRVLLDDDARSACKCPAVVSVHPAGLLWRGAGGAGK